MLENSEEMFGDQIPSSLECKSMIQRSALLHVKISTYIDNINYASVSGKRCYNNYLKRDIELNAASISDEGPRKNQASSSIAFLNNATRDWNVN